MGNKHPSKKSSNLLHDLSQKLRPKGPDLPEKKQSEVPVVPNEAGLSPHQSTLPVNREVQEAPAPTLLPINSALFDLLKLLAVMATGIWRTRQKMLVPGGDQPADEYRKAFRPLESTYQSMLQAGLEIIDRVNQPYIMGLSEKVIAIDAVDGLDREMVIETIKPTILYHGNAIQLGEIVVGAPPKLKNESAQEE